MSREHIGPMERHPGHPETIEQHARELSHLAEQALRVEATTDRTFEAATAHWEGLGAYELLTAPLPVKRRVAAGSEALAWAAAALHYWADRVRSFNQVVADLELRWHLPPRSLNPNASLPTGGPSLLSSPSILRSSSPHTGKSSGRNGGAPTRPTSRKASNKSRRCSGRAPP